MSYATAFDVAMGALERPRPRNDDGEEEFWTKEPPVMEGPRLVRGGFLSHQLEWWGLENFIKLLVGGYGSGKTFTHAKRCISSALTNAPAPVASISPTYRVGRETTVAAIKNMCAGKKTIYGNAWWWRYNKTDAVFEIRFRGRHARILCYSGEDPTALVGPNLAAAYIDEPFLQHLDVFNQMIARVRHPDAVLHEIGLTGTPEQLNWGYDIVYGDKADQHDVGIVHASTRANVTLPSWYVERLEGAFSGKAAQAYIEGQFVDLGEGLVYYSFARSSNIKNLRTDYGGFPITLKDDRGKEIEHRIPPGAELGVGMDFNVNPMSFVVFWTLRDHMHIFKEYTLPNADTEYACMTLLEDFPNRDASAGPVLTEVYPDATGVNRSTAAPGGKSDFWYIHHHGLNVNAKRQQVRRKDRYNAVNGKFLSKSGRVTLTVDPSCKKLIKALMTYRHETMKKQKDLSHLLDAMGYPVAYLFPVSKDDLVVKPILGV